MSDKPKQGQNTAVHPRKRARVLHEETAPETMFALATEDPMAEMMPGGTLTEQRKGGLRLKDALHALLISCWHLRFTLVVTLAKGREVKKKRGWRRWKYVRGLFQAGQVPGGEHRAFVEVVRGEGGAARHGCRREAALDEITVPGLAQVGIKRRPDKGRLP